MARSFDDILGQLEGCISATKQTDLMGPNFDSVDALCIEWLKARGHSVRPPMGHPVKIKKLDELISMFNGFLDKIYERRLLPYSNDKQDRAIAKSFVENRMKHDKIDYETALQQCGLIIQTIFNNQDIFRFESPPTFSILGQASMGWVTDRAVQIINKEIATNEAGSLKRAVDSMTARIESKYTKGRSLEELKVIRKKLEEQHGKKER